MAASCQGVIFHVVLDTVYLSLRDEDLDCWHRWPCRNMASTVDDWPSGRVDLATSNENTPELIKGDHFSPSQP